MAVVEFFLSDLENLVGKKLSEKELTELIPMMGCPFEKLEDGKIYYEIFPNRPDLLSPEGFARALRTFLGLSKGLSKYKSKSSGIKLAAKNVESRPYVVAAVVRNAKLNDYVIGSLIQLQEKIHETFGRKRKKIAIGIHDLDKVKPPFTYKPAKPKEISFIPLDMKEKMNLGEILDEHPKGKEYAHILKGAREYPVITDSNGDVLSFPPIINGELTRVTQHTKNLFIDITGTNKLAINQALNILVTSLAERGFDVETVEVIGKTKNITPDLKPWRMKVSIDYVNKLLDLDLNPQEFRELLGKMGFEYDGYVLVPPYRVDIMHEMDIVEDAAIGKGYWTFEPKIPKVPTIAERSKEDFVYYLRDSLTALGFQEVMSMILTNKEDEFAKMNKREEEVCETLNPVTVECTICRPSLLPSLIKTFSQNKHRDYPQKIFEVGDVLLPDENQETGVAIMKKFSAGISDSKISYEQLSSVLDAFFSNLGIKYSLKKSVHASFIEGRCADIFVGKKHLGVIGELHPSVINNWKLEKPVVALEMDLEEIIKTLT
ncbi:MAG: phenylalanine--tRNA ligase subunit beta [Candidatus Aenigmarchaeota archaeon]|nr:phenylalanine--tRNA ligase subunit beta [Candidatus Aenigmarchaeota archaeon]